MAKSSFMKAVSLHKLALKKVHSSLTNSQRTQFSRGFAACAVFLAPEEMKVSFRDVCGTKDKDVLLSLGTGQHDFKKELKRKTPSKKNHCAGITFKTFTKIILDG